MKKLLMLNYKKDFKRIILEEIALNALLLAILIVYKCKKDFLFQVVAMIKNMPEEFYVFLGIDSGTATGNCSFFLFFTSMMTFLWFGWKAVSDTVKLVHENESSGRIYRICNQLYSRKQIVQTLYVKSLLQFYMRYLLWAAFLLLMLIIGSSNQAQRNNAFSAWGKMIGLGLLVFAVYITISFFYSIIKKNNEASDSFCYVIVFVPWIAANLYKVVGGIKWILRYMEITAFSQGMDAVQMGMEKLYWVSPLSWCNPFTHNIASVTMMQAVSCIAIAGVLFICSENLFERKNFFLP